MTSKGTPAWIEQCRDIDLLCGLVRALDAIDGLRGPAHQDVVHAPFREALDAESQRMRKLLTEATIRLRGRVPDCPHGADIVPPAPIAELDDVLMTMPARAIVALGRNGIATDAAVTSRACRDLVRMRGVGAKTCRAIIAAIGAAGLALKCGCGAKLCPLAPAAIRTGDP